MPRIEPSATWQVHTRQGAAATLHVPVGQIDAAIQRGELEAFRVGKHLRITDEALRKFAGLERGGVNDDDPIARRIAELIAVAPPLTSDQRRRIERLLTAPETPVAAPAATDAA